MMDDKFSYQTGIAPGPQNNILQQFSRNVTEMARNGLLDPVECRDEEITKVLKILSRRKKNNALLLGEPGVGKSAIVEGLAQKIVDKECSPFLHDKEVLMLDMTLIVAGTKFRGEFEERLAAIMDELKKDPNLIVFIDEIHTIVGAGSAAGSMDAANIIKPPLARGEFQCIGATTNEEYKKHFRTDKALDRRFQTVKVEEPSEEDTQIILNTLKEQYELYHKVKYTPKSIERAVELAGKYINDRYFPDKAIDLIDEAGAAKKVEVKMPDGLGNFEEKIEEAEQLKIEAIDAERFLDAAKYRDSKKLLQEQYRTQLDGWFQKLNNKIYTITESDIEEIVATQTGIPVTKLSESERERLVGLEPFLEKIVIGQPEPIQKVSKAVRRNHFGIRDESKPIASFVFLGPTGVGKTWLAKNIAKHIFGDEKALIRVDMSEYSEKIDGSKLGGAAAGYVGYEEGGQLTEKIRNKPYSVVLLDEIEKAHPDVYNQFLQILDDGILTDNKGETVSFKNTVVIMTSNIGIKKLQEFQNPVGFSAAQQNDEEIKTDILMKEMKKFFKPEFLNRLDDVIVFNYLKSEDILKIVDIEVEDLIGRLKKKGFEFRVGPKAKKHLADKGYDKLFGARPLKRTIADLIESPIADECLLNNYSKGLIKVGMQDEKLNITFDCS